MKAIERMTYLGGGTNDADAISYTGQQVFSQTSGARGNVPRIAVLITDGGSANPSAAINAANKARTEHIGMMTVGVGNRINAHELNSIADGSADAFTVSSYDNLDSITDQLINQMCKGTRLTVNFHYLKHCCFKVASYIKNIVWTRFLFSFTFYLRENQRNFSGTRKFSLRYQ